MENVYLLCDKFDNKAAEIEGCPEIGVEFMGMCFGRIVRDDGSVIGQHTSSSFGWLRNDLIRKLSDPSKYNVVDLIGKPVPDRFRASPTTGE